MLRHMPTIEDIVLAAELISAYSTCTVQAVGDHMHTVSHRLPGFVLVGIALSIQHLPEIKNLIGSHVNGGTVLAVQSQKKEKKLAT